MKSLVLVLSVLFSVKYEFVDQQQWISIFDGKSLKDWVSNNENPSAFYVEEGCLVVNGGRAHLFFQGGENNGFFKDFELEFEVKTLPGTNSGVIFHSEFQDQGWLQSGFEVQINNSHQDKSKTGSLYHISDVYNSVANDNVWNKIYIKVNNGDVLITVNDITVTEYKDMGKLINKYGVDSYYYGGLIAIQAHSPGCKAYYRNINIKRL